MSHTFMFVTRKFLSDMEDFTEIEQSQWLTYLQYDNTQIEKKTSNDFFNYKYRDCSGYTDEVWIDIWQYGETIIYDMYGWKESVQFGAIFLEDDLSIILMNKDNNLSWDWCKEEEILTNKIRKDKDNFQQIRSKLIDESIKVYQGHKKEKDLWKLELDNQYIDGGLTELQPLSFPYSIPKLEPMCNPMIGSAKTNNNQYTDKQLAEFQQHEEEQCAREREFLHEFNLKNCKFATKMSDLTETEVMLWRSFLKRDYFLSDSVVDLFDDTEWWDGYNETIRVMYFKWSRDGKVDLLLDMNAWEDTGAIFLENEITFTNNDQDIDALETTPQELKDRVDAYGHIRVQSCIEQPDYDDNHPAHKHCEQTRQKYDKVARQHYTF